MKRSETILMVSAILLGIPLMGNGVFMLFAPESWYWTIPGVPDRGPFNQHFIRDIGILYMLIGGAFIGGAFFPAYRVATWAFGAAWLLGHAAFHVWEVAAGLCGPEALIQDFVGVFLLAFIAAALAFFAKRYPASPT